MTFKICERRGGKSFEAMRRLAANPRAVMIVPTQAQKLNCYPRELQSRIYALDDIRNHKLKGVNPGAVIVENLDDMLHKLLGLSGLEEIDLVTATGVADVSPNPFLGECE